MTLSEFTEHIILANKPLVGGGSIAALCGSLSASLVGLVSSISFDGLDEEKKATLIEMVASCREIRIKLLEDISNDANSFNSVINAFKMPKNTIEEKSARSVEIQKGYKHAVSVPLRVAQISAELFDVVKFLLLHGNKNAETDILTAAMCARISVLAAVYNVKINLKSIKDEEYVSKVLSIVTDLERFANLCEKEILSLSELNDK